MIKKEKETIYEEVDASIRKIYSDRDVDEVKSDIESMFGEMKFIDEKIDDGCDDDEDDNYVMMRSYDFTYKGVDFYIRLYYGDCTGLVGSYDLEIDN